jgi:glycosyltransferase involved in cell wall biosynthesis
VPLPRGHEHAYDARILAREEEEYARASALLCPSDFTLKTFLDAGCPQEKLVRFIYGVDERKYFPSPARAQGDGLTMLFVGVCAVRKGLHFALEAWLRSQACANGRFLIAGEFIEAYRRKLEPLLAHPSVHVLGHRNDVAALMREADLFVLPSIEEGFGLVCTEAMASGAVPLVSDACTDICQHMKNAMVHRVGDVDALTAHIDALQNDRALLGTLRDEGLRGLSSYTWRASGQSLVRAYEQIARLSQPPKVA